MASNPGDIARSTQADAEKVSFADYQHSMAHLHIAEAIEALDTALAAGVSGSAGATINQLKADFQAVQTEFAATKQAVAALHLVPGPAGAAGPQGVPGRSVRVSLASAAPGTAVDGDLWIDNNDAYIFARGIWVNLNGADGYMGPRGADGVSVRSAAATTLTHPSPATASFNPTTGVLSLGLPQGKPGDSFIFRGELLSRSLLPSAAGINGEAYTVYDAASNTTDLMVSDGTNWRRMARMPQGADGAPGAPGVPGADAFEVWRRVTGRPQGTFNDWMNALKGPQGPKGDKGDPGESLKVQGIVADEASLPVNAPPLTVLVDRAVGHLWVYDPSSPVAGPNGWVDMGHLQGPAGSAAFFGPAVASHTNLPTKGSPGEARLVLDTKHVWSWNEISNNWFDAGSVGSEVGPWHRAEYQRGAVVSHNNRLWIAVGRTGTMDEPGMPFTSTGSTSTALRMTTTPLSFTDPNWDWADKARTLPAGSYLYVGPTGTAWSGGGMSVQFPFTPTSGVWAGYTFSEPTLLVNTGYTTLGRDGWIPVQESTITGSSYSWSLPASSNWMLLTPKSLHELLDVNVSGATDGEVLTLQSGEWIAAPSAGGRSTLEALDDTDIPTPQDGEVLTRRNNFWVSEAPAVTAAPSLSTLPDVDATTPPTLLDVLAWNGSKWSPAKWPTPKMVLEQVADVDVNNTHEGDALVFEHGKWINKSMPDWDAINLHAMQDVDIPSPTTGEALVFDTASNTWVAGPVVTPSEFDARLTSVVSGISHQIAVDGFASTPPAAPSDGDVYIVKGPATGVFNGQADRVATWHNGAWVFASANTGDTHFCESDQKTYTWNGTSWVLVASATATAGGGPAAPVGTIIQSMLSDVEFDTAYPVEAAKWRLCDGRSAVGTRYASITGQAVVPDLRGAYLRMAGNNAASGRTGWQGGALRSFFDWMTGRPKTALTMSSNGQHNHNLNTTGSHNHSIHTVGEESSHGWVASGAGGWMEWTPTTSNDMTMNGDHTHTVDQQGNHAHTINGGGDAETRPNTYTVNYFVRVDD